MRSLDDRMSNLGASRDDLLKPVANSEYFAERLGRVTGSDFALDYLTRPDGAPLTATPSLPVSKAFSFANGQLTPS